MGRSTAFNSISANTMQRASHDLSHKRIFTMNMGDLVPIMVQDVIPGDSWQLKQECLMRMMPMLAPIYHNINVYIHYFFVPNRIIWNEWEDFITGGKNGDSKPVFPRFIVPAAADLASKQNSLGIGTLADYLGFPVKNLNIDADFNIPETHAFSQLPFRAYAKIYNEYYRDQNLEDEIKIDEGSGIANFNALASNNQYWQFQAPILRKRAWEKDYFTSALPWTQRGTQMTLPITGDAPLVSVNQTTGEKTTQKLGDPYATTQRYLQMGGTGTTTGDQLFADMSNINSATINELRQAFQIQKWMERSARSGSRYTEVLQSFFGVSPRDSRLQRPEFLGGGKMPLSISEVLQTSETSTTPLGEFAGHGITYGSTARFRKFFTEHGLIIGIMSVLPRTAYCQGLPKVFKKFDKYDYFWKEFAHLGEQEIKNSEIYYDVEAGNKSNETFGYTARYNEYRYIPDTIHGQMLTTLSYWHLGRMFGSLPVLNNNFIKADPSTRIFPVQDNSHKLIVQTYAQVRAIRPVPKYGDPLGI